MPITHFLHSDIYYLSVITKLIECLNAGFTDAQTAKALNDAAILSPSSKPFTANTVSQILKKLRLHREYSSKLHRVLLQLVFEGKLNAADTLILFQPRRQPGAM